VELGANFIWISKLFSFNSMRGLLGLTGTAAFVGVGVGTGFDTSSQPAGQRVEANFLVVSPRTQVIVAWLAAPTLHSQKFQIVEYGLFVDNLKLFKSFETATATGWANNGKDAASIETT
jgi:hypothetical protein